MKVQHRLIAAAASIGAGIIVAVVGWFGVSGETDVAFQLPFLASAGVAALMLFAGGCALLISAQLTSDAERLRDIEEGLRLLATEVGRLGDELAPPRERPALHAVDGSAKQG